jgi:hypothetical protein
MLDPWGRHEVDRLIGALDEGSRWKINAAFRFFGGDRRSYPFVSGVDRETIMALLVKEWRRIATAENFFEHERERLIEESVTGAADAERPGC